MARIRTIKPEFWRHEGLQDVANEHGAHVMLVFAALWGHCDRAGRFLWKPRSLKLDILPFLNFDMGEALEVLRAAGFVQKYQVDGKEYGCVPSFGKHQRISGKEAQEPEKFPAPVSGDAQGSNGEAPEKHLPGQEREREREREEEGKEREAREQVPASPLPNPKSKSKGSDVRGSRWPADREVDPDWVTDAELCRQQANLPPIDLHPEAIKFQNFWAAKSGAGATKVDWRRTWLNWALNARGSPKPPQPNPDRLARLLADVEAERIAKERVNGQR